MISRFGKWFFFIAFCFSQHSYSKNLCHREMLGALLASLKDYDRKIKKGGALALNELGHVRSAEEIFFINRWMRQTRDGFRKFLQVRINKNKYAVTDPTHPAKANYWARSLLGMLEAGEENKLNIEDLGKELLKDIGEIKKFPEELLKYAADAATLASKKLSIEHLPYTQVVRSDNSVPYLFFTPKPDRSGALIPNHGSLVFPSDVHFAIDQNALASWLPFFSKSPEMRDLHQKALTRGKEQAERIAKLYIFYSEFYRHRKAISPNRLIANEENRALIRELESLFEPNSLEVLSDYRVSEQVLQTVKWKQLSTELRMAFVKLKISGIIDLIKSLPEKEKVFLHTENLSEKLEWWKRTRWGTLFSALAIPGGGVSIWTIAYNVIYQDTIAKEECAQKETEQEFLDCSFAYLKFKAESRSIHFTQNDFAALLNKDGTVNDPRLVEEVADITERRNAFVFGKKWEEGMELPLKSAVLKNLLGSDTFLKNLVKIKDDKEFRKLLLDMDPHQGFLMFNFPIAYSTPGVSDMVTTILDAKTDQERDERLDELSKLVHTANLSQALKSLLDARKDFFSTDEIRAEESIRALLHTVGPFLKR